MIELIEANWLLILLAVLAGFLPALAAYRTDVSRVLSGNP